MADSSERKENQTEEDLFGKEVGLMHKVIVTGRKAGADKRFWTTLADNENIFRKVVEDVVGGGNSCKYANEEVSSNCTYPKEYKGPKPINDQIKAIAKIFGLDPSHALEYAKNLPELNSFVPTDALKWTGYFAILYEQRELAKKHFPEVTDPVQKYCQAVQLVHTKIAYSRSFYNYREGQITPTQLRVHARTAHALDLIAETQKGDILIVAAQLGMRHRGRSVRRAREVFTANEFGLGSLAVGSIVLTHPEREVKWEQLHVDCAGDELSPVASGDFSVAPFFEFFGGKVDFFARWYGDALKNYGSASGFLPAEAR